MFIRGSGSGIESNRKDISPYKGIVVKNNDPLKLHRVKIFIPELSNQPFDEWLGDNDEINIKIPGINTDNSWKDVKIFEEICNNIPWAEPCFPIFGETNNSRFYSDGENSLAVISDCNYEEGFEYNNNSFPTLTGSFSPSFIYENPESMMPDAFTNPLDNYSVKCNTYAYSYKPMKFSNKGKGIFGIPEVGSKVWVFHYLGDLNFPVYFGSMQDYRTLALINRTDNDNKISNTYPNDFEN